MKHLGILATTPEGAALCFRAFCQEGFRRLGPNDHPDVTLDSTPLARTLPAWEKGEYSSVRATLSVSAQRLARAGAVADQAVREGRTRAGVLGTKFTMDGPVYPRALAARGIDVDLPVEDDRAILNKIIFEELVSGVFTESSREECVRIIEGLAARGCDAVALVCTEIPLLVPPDTSPLPALDSTRLLARAAFDVAVGHRPLPTWRGGPIGE
jgi:amino-acid racemase